MEHWNKFRRGAGVWIAAGVILGGLSAARAQDSSADHVYRARAVLKGAPGSNITGIVTFTQTTSSIVSTVLVEAMVLGLKPGEKHGLHIHEFGSCTDQNPVTGATGAFNGA